jgi:copper chaperone CopZ
VITFRVPRMTCRRDVRAITARLRDLPGVEGIQADASTGSLVVEGRMSAQEVHAMLNDMGFPADGRASTP